MAAFDGEPTVLMVFGFDVGGADSEADEANEEGEGAENIGNIEIFNKAVDASGKPAEGGEAPDPAPLDFSIPDGRADGDFHFGAFRDQADD